MRGLLRTEDGWAVLVGLLVIGLALPAAAGFDLLGWSVTTKVWVTPDAALAPASKAFAAVPGWVSLLLTFAFLLAVLTAGAGFLGTDRRRFAGWFALLFAVSYAAWVAGHYAYVAATPDKRPAGVAWSLGLTGEAGYIVALLAGLAVGNLAPGVAARWQTAARSEWFIKTAVVILGASLGVKAATATGLTSAIMFRGLAAIVEAYLIYWAVVYYVARRFFGFSREWAAPLASGISICGVSAAITTGAAVRARPVVPVMVSSLVVLFSVVELLVLPAAARAFLSHEPMVAAAWMGLAVKTDGAAFSSGAVTEALVLAEIDPAGTTYDRGWMVLTTSTVKIFIDVFIGIWAVVLAAVWAWGVERREGAGRLPLADIWARFPKFVFGYLLAFAALFAVGVAKPSGFDLAKVSAVTEPYRQLFFAMTFFAIGLGSNFRRLWAEGLGRLALMYAVSLFGFIIWVGLAISWLFFHGVLPPPVKGA